MKKDRKKNKPKVGLFKSVRVVFPIILKASPWLFALSCSLFLVQTLLMAFNVYVREYIFNGVDRIVHGTDAVRAVFISICIMTGIYVVNQGLSWILNYIDIKFSQRANIAQQVHRFEKLSRLEPIIYENTDDLDDLEKVNNGKDSARNLVNIFKTILFNSLPYIIVVSIYLLKHSVLLVIAMLCVFVPTLIQQLVIKNLYTDNEDKAAPLRRKQNYYAECITSQAYYKETRLLGAYGFFIGRFRDTLKHIIKLDIKTGLKKESIFFVTSLISVIGKLGVYYLLFVLLMDGKISVGEFAAVYSAVWQLEGKFDDLFYNTFSSISQNLSYVENYVRFIEFKEDDRYYVELPNDVDIKLENVKFVYPNSDKNALDGVDLYVSPKETVAIVGENGSGKSTLIKLITGYYRPSEGCVKLNGHSTDEMSFASVAKITSACFQRYPNYALTLRENIKIGDIEKAEDDSDLVKACNMAGFSPSDEWLPNGFDTMLSREFDDGVGLSGGQLQKVAIARAFYRDSGIIILDEPTAAIDPIEESRIYHRFAELSRGKTSFIVTHRLASVKIADRIVMMKNGRIIETGTHEELMQLNGEYKKMYDSQKQWYENEAESETVTA